MKDAYSFHTSQEDLATYYQSCLKAYHRIYKRVGLPEVIAVASDSGMMGGSVSHEFMLLTPIGEDSIAICPDCGYCANMEAAENILPKKSCKTSEPLALVHTPIFTPLRRFANFFTVQKSNPAKLWFIRKTQMTATLFCSFAGI